MLKKYLVLLIVILMILFIGMPGYANPWVMRGGDETIAKNQTIEGDLLFGGGRLEIDGVVKGDLIVFASDLVINGQIEGSLLGVVYNEFKFNGSVGRDFRVLASDITFDGTVQRSANIGAARFYTGAKSRIEGGLLGVFTDLNLAGFINGPVDVSAYYAAKISGEITGDLKMHGIGAEWRRPLKISGKITDYTGDNDPTKRKGITISGGYETEEENPAAQLGFLKIWYQILFVWFLGTLLLSLIFYRLYPRTAWGITEPTPGNFRRSLLIGLIGFIGIPLIFMFFVLIMIMFPLTMVGLPFVILLVLIYLFLSLFNGVLVYLWFGRLVFKSKLKPNLMIILGGVLIMVINFLPIISIFFTWIGFGLMLGSIKTQIKG